jgi:hypothetical protein
MCDSIDLNFESPSNRKVSASDFITIPLPFRHGALARITFDEGLYLNFIRSRVRKTSTNARELPGGTRLRISRSRFSPVNWRKSLTDPFPVAARHEALESKTDPTPKTAAEKAKMTTVQIIRRLISAPVPQCDVGEPLAVRLFAVEHALYL